MRKLYILLFAAFSLSAHAQFSGAYQPAKWTLTRATVSNGSVNTAGAPTSITLRGSDGSDASDVDTDFTITAIASGTWSFNWSYHSNDSYNDPSYDIAGIVINGVFTPVSSTTGSIDQSGTFVAPFVTAGTTIGFRVRATDNIEGDATFTISSFSPPGGILPVHFIDFKAIAVESHVRLDWKTGAEINTSHFGIERSADGRQFMAIGQVAAISSGSTYTFTDVSPLPLAYYRIRGVDHDGSLTYSTILLVQGDKVKGLKAYVQAPGTVVVTVDAAMETKDRILVWDAAGRLLHQQEWQLQKGVNTGTISLRNVAGGVHYIRLQGGGNTVTLVQ